MSYDVSIDESLFEVYPEIKLGLMMFKADVKAPDDAFWNYMDGEVLPQVRKEIEGKEWGEIPGIRGSRAAYKAFGRNPGRYRVSSESLIRRVRREDDLYHINSVVDVNNLLSVKSGLSVGSYDHSKIHGPITLRKAGQGEGYEGIGKEFPDMFKPLASAMAKALGELRERNDVKWTYISPAGDFQADGERSGKYILGGEELTLNSRNESIISYADYAIAMIDEIEKGDHIQQRISVVRA